MSEKVSLKQFIDENYRLFTAMGVTAGLTALFTRLENAEYLVFLSFVMFVLLEIELLLSLKGVKETSYNMALFKLLSLYLLVAVSTYIILFYIDYLPGFLPPLLAIIFGGTILRFLRQKTSPTLKFLGLLIILFFAGFIGTYLIQHFLLKTL